MRFSSTVRFVLPALLFAQIPFSAKAEPNNQITMHAKPAVVRIVTGCAGAFRDYRSFRDLPFTYNPPNSATGFFISSDGYIATNAHVVEKSLGSEQNCKKNLERNLREKLKKDEKLSDERITNLLSTGQIELLQDRFYYANHVVLPNTSGDTKLDPFLYEVKERGSAEDKGGKDVAILKIEVKDAPVLPLTTSTPLQPQDPIVVIGYPGAADINSRVNSTSLLEATITEGIVSNPNKTLENGASVIQVDVRVEPGSSGSPVLNDKGEVVGIIVLKKLDNEGNGIPFAIPTSAIQEYVRAAGAVNQQGLTDSLYREGLERFLQRDYPTAKTKFQAVISLFPQHSEANRLIRETDQKIAERTQTNNYLPLVAGVSIAVLGLLGAYFIVRRRSTPAVAEGFGMDEDYRGRDSEQSPRQSKSGFHPLTILSPHRHQPSAVTVTQSSLALKNAQGEERHFPLQEQMHRLGRDRTWADLKLPDDGWEVLSKRHAILRREGDSYRIYDGDGNGHFSTNRILINGVLVSPEGYLLKDGDQLKIGHDPINQVNVTYHAANPLSAVRPEANSRDGNG